MIHLNEPKAMELLTSFQPISVTLHIISCTLSAIQSIFYHDRNFLTPFITLSAVGIYTSNLGNFCGKHSFLQQLAESLLPAYFCSAIQICQKLEVFPIFLPELKKKEEKKKDNKFRWDGLNSTNLTTLTLPYLFDGHCIKKKKLTQTQALTSSTGQ